MKSILVRTQTGAVKLYQCLKVLTSLARNGQEPPPREKHTEDARSKPDLAGRKDAGSCVGSNCEYLFHTVFLGPGTFLPTE